MKTQPMDVSPFSLALVDEVAKFICDFRHGGIDVWDMLGDQQDRKNHWRAEALFYCPRHPSLGSV